LQLYLKPVHTSRASWRAVQASRFAVRRFCAPASVTLGAALVLLLEAPSVTAAQTPLSYLSASGARAYPINSLLWALLAISVAVIVMSIVLLLLGILRGNALPGNALPGRLMIERPGRGIGWIVVGVGASTAVLFGAAVWTVVTLAAVSSPPGGHADLHLEVTGHQWWWEVLYKDPSPNLTFKTANEIHIPVDRNVSVDLRTADVIHSFWVPSLTGKTDLIPGQINQTWFSASRPGVYRGQCTEYCGRQHAHMALEVVADDPGAFKAWRDHALQPVAAPVSVEGAGDLDAFVRRCGACHAVAGTRAGGILGPDLSHLMSRHTIAAGALPNSIGHLSAWIADPQHIKPGAYMPRLDVSGPELTRIRRFLLTLQ
jgi:cytochrome c oxidase subunit 2